MCAVIVQGFYMRLAWVYKKKMAGVRREIFSWQSQAIRNAEHIHTHTHVHTHRSQHAYSVILYIIYIHTYIFLLSFFFVFWTNFALCVVVFKVLLLLFIVLCFITSKHTVKVCSKGAGAICIGLQDLRAHAHIHSHRVVDIYCDAFQFHFRGKAHTLGIPTQLRCFCYPAAAIILLLLLF